MHAIEEIKERARAAADKPAAFGPDLDLCEYTAEPGECAYVESLEELEDIGAEELARAGFGAFAFAQTLFRPPEELTAPETPREGYGEGSFVVVRAGRRPHPRPEV